MVHDFNLATHILELFLRDELALGDALAGVLETCGNFSAQVGDAELALAKLAAERIKIFQVFALVLEDGVVRGEGLLEWTPGDDVGHGRGEVKGKRLEA
jgi:hypothetical protein